MKGIERRRPELAPTGENVLRFVNMLRTQAFKLARAEQIEVEDARQEIAIWVAEALAQFDSHAGPLRPWVKRYVSFKVVGRVRIASAVKRVPTLWEYEQEIGWQRMRAPVTGDLGVIDDLPADAESAPTPEALLLQAERRQRFRDAIDAARARLLDASTPTTRAVAERVFDGRLLEAVDSGRGRRDDAVNYLRDELQATRPQERYHWLKARRLLEQELRARGELCGPQAR